MFWKIRYMYIFIARQPDRLPQSNVWSDEEITALYMKIKETCHSNQKSQAPLPTECFTQAVNKWWKKNYESDFSFWSFLDGNAKTLRTDLNWGQDRDQVNDIFCEHCRVDYIVWGQISDILHIFWWKKLSDMTSVNLYIWNIYRLLFYMLLEARCTKFVHW